MSHPIEAYAPSARTKRFARLYVRILSMPKKTARHLGTLTKILVAVALPESDLIRIGRSEALHTSS